MVRYVFPESSDDPNLYRIDKDLVLWAQPHPNSNSPRPFVSFGYSLGGLLYNDQKNSIQLRFGISSSLWSHIEQLLQQRTLMQLGQGEKPLFEYSLGFSLQKTNYHFPAGVFLVSLGASDYHKAPQVTQEIVDEIGADVLSLGLMHNHIPIWATSNYEFQGIKTLRETRISNSDLTAYIDRLQSK